jgi:hypothetical protein
MMRVVQTEERKAYMRAYRLKNGERIRSKMRAYSRKHKERELDRTRRWREANPERVREHGRHAWETLKADPERLTKRNESQRRYNTENRTKAAERKKRYYKEYPEKAVERRRGYYTRNMEKVRAYHRRYYDEHYKSPGSWPEQVVRHILDQEFGTESVIERDRATVKNPELGGRYLELDFWIPSRRLAIEVQGPYHRRPIRGRRKLQETQRRDALKRRLCGELGIRLIEIEVEDGKHYVRPVNRRKLLRFIQECLAPGDE